MAYLCHTGNARPMHLKIYRNDKLSFCNETDHSRNTPSSAPVHLLPPGCSESRGRGGLGGLKLQPTPTSTTERRQLLELSDGPSLKLDVEMPKLIEHDLQDLLYEPVTMPVRRYVATTAAFSCHVIQ